MLALLESREWATTAEINSVEYGGTSGGRRLRELREHGFDIEHEPISGSSQRRYRLQLPVDGQQKLFELETAH